MHGKNVETQAPALAIATFFAFGKNLVGVLSVYRVASEIDVSLCALPHPQNGEFLFRGR